MPTYVARDVDGQIARVLRQSETSASFVLVVGGSSVGKTRTAFEAVLKAHPTWQLFHPADVADLRMFASSPEPATVVWLDEIQGYLADGLTAAVVRQLLHCPRMSLLGTIWPQPYQTYITPPSGLHLRDGDGPGHQDDEGKDIYRNERDVLKLASVITLDEDLSDTERIRASHVAKSDPRIAATLTSSYGMTQALASAPALVDRWRHAPSAYSQALLTAAIDCRRLGIQSPINIRTLRGALPSYLTPAEHGDAPTDWFESALSYATQPLLGAPSALEPWGSEMGVIQGYTVADYLHQYGIQERGSKDVPEGAWHAYLNHVDNGRDLHVLAQAAVQFGHKSLALRLSEESVIRGYARARLQLGDLLRAAGRSDDAIAVLHDGIADSEYPTWEPLASLLELQGHDTEAADVYRQALENGYHWAAHRMTHLFERIGRAPEAASALRASAVGGNHPAWELLAGLLGRTATPTEVIDMWREALATGYPSARENLGLELRKGGRDREAIDLWIKAGTDGVHHGWTRAAELLGRSEEAIEVWEKAIIAGSPRGWDKLAELFMRLGRPADAARTWRRALAAGHQGAASELASLHRRLKVSE